MKRIFLALLLLLTLTACSDKHIYQETDIDRVINTYFQSEDTSILETLILEEKFIVLHESESEYIVSNVDVKLDGNTGSSSRFTWDKAYDECIETKVFATDSDTFVIIVINDPIIRYKIDTVSIKLNDSNFEYQLPRNKYAHLIHYPVALGALNLDGITFYDKNYQVVYKIK